MEVSEGFLLSYIKYGDHNAVMHIFTLQEGYKSYFIRGIYSPKNKTKAYLIPLNHIQFRVQKGHQQGSMESISKLEIVQNQDFSQDVKAASIIFFLADFLNQILRNENQSPEIFSAIGHLLHRLADKDYKSHLIFMFEILQLQGLEPLESPGKFLNPETGKFEQAESHHLFNAVVSDLWRSLSSNIELYSIRIPPIIRRQFLNSLLVYYHYHYAEFKQPQSLEIVQQIFE